MPTTNLYFNNYSFTGEQRLIEDLIIEAIKIYGVECYYLPRTLVNEDEIWNEDTSSKFESAYPLEMYIKNVDAFEGEGDFLSKFGLEIRDSVTLTISQRRFGEELSPEDTTADVGRPSEGDLIWFPLNGKIFEVQHVEHEAIFYQLGSLQTYDLRCELFEYSSEIIDTGVKVIDDIGTKFDIDELIYQILFETYTDTAFAETTISNGLVTRVDITHPGSNFLTEPTVTFESPQGTPQRANTVATVVQGRIASTSVIDGGGYYSYAPVITFAAPLDARSRAQGLSILNKGELEGVSITDGGYFYHQEPTVSVSAPDGTNILGGILVDGAGVMGPKALYYPDQTHFYTIEDFSEGANNTLDFFYKINSVGASGTLFDTEHYRLSLNNGRIEMTVPQLPSVIGTVEFLPNQWHYVHLSANSSLYTLHVDGVQEMQLPHSHPRDDVNITIGDTVGNTASGYYDAIRFRDETIMNIATPITVATNAEATVAISQGLVTSVTVTEEGGYYVGNTNVTISHPGNYSHVALADCTLLNLGVDSVQVTNGGFYYTSPPTVEFSAPSVYSTDTAVYGTQSLLLANSSTTYQFGGLTETEEGTLNFDFLHDTNSLEVGDILSTDDWKFSRILNSTDPNSLTFDYVLRYPNNSIIIQNRNWTSFAESDVEEFTFVSVQVKRSQNNKILKVRVEGFTNTISSATTSLPVDFALHGTEINFGGLANTYVDAVILSDYTSDDLQAEPTTLPPLGTYAPWGGANIYFANSFEYTTTAQGTPFISNGAVVSITIDDPGYGYQEPPVITISTPNTASYYAATADVSVVNGHVTSVTVTDSGVGYFNVPSATFTTSVYNEFEARVTYHSNNILYAQDFEYKNASGTSVINANGIVTSVVIDDRGFGYEIPPTITFSLPNTDFYYSASATTSVSNGQVVSVNVTNTGFGYTQANVYPVVELPIYNTAEGSANISSSGVVTSVTITDSGSGYTNAPKIYIRGEPITGALQSEDNAFFLHEDSNTSSRSTDTGYDDNEYIQQQVESTDPDTNLGFIDFSEKNPFSEGSDW